MSAAYPSWLVGRAASASMIVLGVRMRMLAVPELKTRCPACRRLSWRGRRCPCTGGRPL
jgi:hypothetical protein